MSKLWIVKAALIICFPLSSYAYGVRDFITTAGKGILVGATLGVVSLAFEDHPEDSWNNVARGASLGLYGGIAYGFYLSRQDTVGAPIDEDGYALLPLFSKDKKLEGVVLNRTIYSF